VAEHLDKVRAVLAEGELTGYEVAPKVFGEAFGAATGPWLFTETMAFLGHLEHRGEARRIAGDPEKWALD
jgi:hypothetical protein